MGLCRVLEDTLYDLLWLNIHPVIDSIYEFAEARKAYDRPEEGAFGKIVIRVRN